MKTRTRSKGMVSEEAREFVLAALSAGPMDSSDLMSAALAAGHSRSTVMKARQDLGVRADKGRGLHGKWFLRLPT